MSVNGLGGCWIESDVPLTDGAELTLFVWREFCERPEPPAVQGQSVEQVITALRAAFAVQFAG
ncbi:hypothetical protein D3C77_523900 [compost metagenome]